jgi:hypothetical protein
MLRLSKKKDNQMSKTNLTKEDIEYISDKVSDLLANEEKRIIEIVDKRLDLYYEYYQRTNKLVNMTLFITIGVFIMSLMLYVKIIMLDS